MDNRFGFIGLEPSVSSKHMWLLLYAPFVLLGVMNLFVMLAAVYVRFKAPGPTFLAKAVTA
jgi:hypothetical protein